MLKKLNTALRLLVVGLLIYPFPIAIAQEVTVNEGFSDQDWDGYFTITRENGNSHNTVYTENSNYGTQGQFLSLCHQVHGSCTHEYTFEFDDDYDVYEVGFEVGAVNQAYSVTWHYSDDTTETENKSAQAYGNNGADMYDTFYKSFTDYNAVAENTDKFITKFVIDIHDWSSFDDMYFQYDDGLTQGIGAPTGLDTTQNLHSGAVGVTWTAPTGYTNTPERYAIAFSDDNFQNTNFAVATTQIVEIRLIHLVNSIYFLHLQI